MDTDRTSPANEPLLAGWKSISQYLQVGVRTAQRWEQESNLPVRRPSGGLKPTVVAYQSELNVWVRGPRSRDAEASDDESARNHSLLQAIEALRNENRNLLRLLKEKYPQHKEVTTQADPPPNGLPPNDPPPNDRDSRETSAT